MTKGYPDWMRAFLLLGKHGADYLPVLLGPDGSLYCVLQGEYQGALQTVKLDDQGRLSAFVVDSSDAWNQMLQIGNAELAARLNSIVRLDRRGTVMFIDGFEDGSPHWVFSLSGTNGLHSVTPLKAFSGGYSLRLTASTDGGRWTEAASIVPTCLVTSVGISAMLRTQTVYAYATIFLVIDSGVLRHQIYAKLDYASQKIYVWNANGSYEEVASYTVDIGDQAGYHMLKIVGNISTKYYIRLLYDNVEYDISAIGVRESAYVATPRIYIGINIFGASGQPSAVADYDDVIVTSEI